MRKLLWYEDRIPREEFVIAGFVEQQHVARAAVKHLDRVLMAHVNVAPGSWGQGGGAQPHLGLPDELAAHLRPLHEDSCIRRANDGCLRLAHDSSIRKRKLKTNGQARRNLTKGRR